MIARLQPRVRTTPIGVDIGAGGVRAVQLTRRGAHYSVSQSTLAEWSDRGGEQGVGPIDLPARLRQCIHDGRFRGRVAVTGLSSAVVDLQALELPWTLVSGPPVDLARVVNVELARMRGDVQTESEARHWPLPATQVTAPSVVAATVDRAAVLERLQQCASAGLNCTCVDAQALALSRFAVVLAPPAPDTVWGVLDLGYDQTSLVVCVDESPVLVRRAGVGGRIWTERIAQTLHVSFRSAEIHKREHGIAIPRRGERRRSSDARDAEIPAILQAALRVDLRELAAEIKRSYEYVLSCYPKRRAAHLVLVGGGAATRNLPESLGDVLAIPVRRAADLLIETACRLELASVERDRLETFAVAIGLVVEA